MVGARIRDEGKQQAISVKALKQMGCTSMHFQRTGTFQMQRKLLELLDMKRVLIGAEQEKYLNQSC